MDGPRLDIAGFYDADERRRTSDELEYGDGWTTHADPHAAYSAKWVADTGELYTVREPHPGGLLARYLDQLDVDAPETAELTVEVLGRFPDRAAVDEALAGWQQAVGTDESLEWLRERATRAG